MLCVAASHICLQMASIYWERVRNDVERYKKYLETRKRYRNLRYRNDDEYRERMKETARNFYHKKKQQNVAV